MEAQQQRLVDSRSLGTLVRAWNEKGTPLPVAITVSILDDLLQEPSAPTCIDAVIIDDRGVARTDDGELASSFSEFMPIVKEMLGDGEAVPPSARALLARITSDDPTEHPADADQLRSWIRTALGAPAAREEVIACVESSMDLGIESLLPPPSLIEEVDDVDEDDVPTLRPEPKQEESSFGLSRTPELVDPEETELLEPLSALEGAPWREPGSEGGAQEPREGRGSGRVLDPSADLVVEAHADTVEVLPPSEGAHTVETRRDSPETKGRRPVVRHQSVNQPRISVGAAPAARKSPRPLTAGPGDSLILPAERRGNWGIWLFVAALIAAALWFYVFRPV